MDDQHIGAPFDSPVNTSGYPTACRPKQLGFDSLTCQAPPGGFLPRTRWGMALSVSCHQVRTDSAVPPKSVSGRRRVSNRRDTGLWDRPSKPSDRYSKSWRDTNHMLETCVLAGSRLPVTAALPVSAFGVLWSSFTCVQPVTAWGLPRGS